MNQKFLMVILFALGVSAVASFGLYTVVTRQTNTNKAVPTTPVIAACAAATTGRRSTSITTIPADRLKTLPIASSVSS